MMAMSRYLQTKQAAEYLGTTESALRASAARRQVPHRRKGRLLIFDTVELDSYMAHLKGMSAKEVIQEVVPR